MSKTRQAKVAISVAKLGWKLCVKNSPKVANYLQKLIAHEVINSEKNPYQIPTKTWQGDLGGDLGGEITLER